jgi:tetratricopeptide (TPR) repeat protein
VRAKNISDTSFSSKLAEGAFHDASEILRKEFIESETHDILNHLILLLKNANNSGKFREVAIWVENNDLVEKINSILNISDIRNLDLANELGKLSRSVRKNSLAEQFYNFALRGYEQIEDIEGISTIKINIGNLYLSSGSFQNAALIFEELLQTSSEIVDIRSLVMMNYGSCLYQMGDIDGAKKQYLASFELFTNLGDTKSLANICMNLGVMDLNQLLLDGAKSWFEKAEQYYKAAENVRGEIVAKENLTKVLLQEKKIDKAVSTGIKLLELIDPYEDYRLFARITSLIIDNMTVNQVDTYLLSYIQQNEIRPDDPIDVFKVFYETCRILVKNQVNMDHAISGLKKLLAISRTNKDEEAEVLILLQLMWAYTHPNNENELNQVIDQIKQVKFSNRQIDFDLALNLLHRGKAIPAFNTVKRYYDKKSWGESSSKYMSTVILIAAGLNQNEKFVKKWINDLKSMESHELAHPIVHLIFQLLPANISNLLITEVNYELIESLKTGQKNENCVDDHISRLTNKEVILDCVPELCTNLLTFILESFR